VLQTVKGPWPVQADINYNSIILAYYQQILRRQGCRPAMMKSIQLIIFGFGMMAMAWTETPIPPTIFEVDQGDGCVVVAQIAWKQETGQDIFCVIVKAQAVCDYKSTHGPVHQPVYQSTLPAELSADHLGLSTIVLGGFTPDTSQSTLKPSTVMPHLILDNSEYWFSRGRLYNLSALAFNPTTEEETIIRPMDGLIL
jgi:hypothetical protein